jgi:hypothetical protein
MRSDIVLSVDWHVTLPATGRPFRKQTVDPLGRTQATVTFRLSQSAPPLPKIIGNFD